MAGEVELQAVFGCEGMNRGKDRLGFSPMSFAERGVEVGALPAECGPQLVGAVIDLHVAIDIGEAFETDQADVGPGAGDVEPDVDAHGPP